MSDKPPLDYKEMLKRHQAAHTTLPEQKTKQGMADIKTVLIKDIVDMKSTLIKWTIIILIAACIFYFVCPKYSFRFPTANYPLLYKANKITGTVEVYHRGGKGKWTAR